MTEVVSEADVLVESVFGTASLLFAKTWRYTFSFSGEIFLGQRPSAYTAVLSGCTAYPNCVSLPLLLPFMFCNKIDYRGMLSPKTIPPKFICSLISNPNVYVRNAFIDRIEARGLPIDHGGLYKCIMPRRIDGSYEGATTRDFIKQYRFVIAMENSQDSYYLTEKICHGFTNGTIPIYWGCPNVTEYFNKDRFIILTDCREETIDTIIDRIVAMTDEEYLEIVSRPIMAEAYQERDVQNSPIAALRGFLAKK